MHIKNKHQNSVVLVPFISLKQHKQIQPINYKSYNLYINPLYSYMLMYIILRST